MATLFPTRPGGLPEGPARRAEHCVCAGPVHRGRCTRCGKWPERTVDETFQRQNFRNSRGQRNVIDLDEYRTRRSRLAA